MRFTLDGELFELTPSVVRNRLSGELPERIQSYWVEIDGIRWPVKQVISLATGVADRGRFQSQSSRRWLHKLGFTIGRDKGRLDLNQVAAKGMPRSDMSSLASSDAPRPDVVLVGCVKTKRDHEAPAKDLYVSNYFRKMRAYAEATGKPWFILSAEHGLVAPDDSLTPYNRYLPETSREYRREWGRRVASQLEQSIGDLSGQVIEVHAGAAYVDAVEEALRPSGAVVSDRLKGLSFGRRLSWYLRRAGSGDDAAIVAQLRDRSASMSLSDFLATNGESLRCPGMYSWWVDESGAYELSQGLGHRVDQGLIYAGLAGATRSGGSTSSNTLWGRIATMHLGKRHSFSTLRYSLGSILSAAHSHPTIDEEQLTSWMHAHLRIVAVPVADADLLDALETIVLRELDPPMNLAKVPRTAFRRQLSALRREYADARTQETDEPDVVPVRP